MAGSRRSTESPRLVQNLVKFDWGVYFYSQPIHWRFQNSWEAGVFPLSLKSCGGACAYQTVKPCQIDHRSCAQVLVADIEPGDLLLIPAHWFHFVVAVTASISVNVWSLSSHARAFSGLLSDAIPLYQASWPLDKLIVLLQWYVPNTPAPRHPAPNPAPCTRPWHPGTPARAGHLFLPALLACS